MFFFVSGFEFRFDSTRFLGASGGGAFLPVEDKFDKPLVVMGAAPVTSLLVRHRTNEQLLPLLNTEKRIPYVRMYERHQEQIVVSLGPYLEVLPTEQPTLCVCVC